MKSIPLFFLFAIVFIANAQNDYDFNQIDDDFQEFNKTLSLTPINSDNKITIINSQLPTDDFKLSSTETFSIFSNQNHEASNLIPAIIQSISQKAKYTYVTDIFEQRNSSNQTVSKELLKIEITEIPDTTSFRLINQQILNKAEEIFQFQFSKTIKLESPIYLYYYFSISESNQGVLKSSKIKISDDNRDVFESTKQNNKYEICRNGNLSILSNQIINYSNKSTDFYLQAGLQNHFLEILLKQLANKIFISSNNIKQVKDNYGKLNKDLKRSTAIGTLYGNTIILKELIIPKFEEKTTYEIENNKQQIIERHSEFYKKSETNFTNNIKHGPEKNWNKNGNLTKSSFYRNGRLDGDYCEYYSDLSPKIITKYKNGEIVDTYNSFHANGNPKEIFKYKNGLKQGKQKIFHENGILKHKGKYKKNQPKGWHYYFDSFGNRIKKEKYKNGKLIASKSYN